MELPVCSLRRPQLIGFSPLNPKITISGLDAVPGRRSLIKSRAVSQLDRHISHVDRIMPLQSLRIHAETLPKSLLVQSSQGTGIRRSGRIVQHTDQAGSPAIGQKWKFRSSGAVHSDFMSQRDSLRDSLGLESSTVIAGRSRSYRGRGVVMSATGGSPVATSSPFSPLWRRGQGWTYSLVALNVLVFAASHMLAGVKYLGIKDNAKIAQGEWWRLLSSAFLHADFYHLFVNMSSLLNLGPAVQRKFGTRVFLAIYFLSAIASSCMSYSMNPLPSLGASGAICGLLGAEFAYALQLAFLQVISIESVFKSYLQTFAINSIMWMAISSRIDHWGHLGGFLGGLFTSWLLGPLLLVLPTGRIMSIIDASLFTRVRVGLAFLGIR
eukprot:TRINITY_DN23822_c0_g1_i1.p1 TRINITY_DN23822_c0_g1~~TRINITY_DN23822_c0_g1_i1.p1  ORF type:complete len:381 (-),score=19.11 TRINITY_DN23822_c0_g1_i1:317-1459(-)